MEANRFVELAAVNVNDHVEKKGSLSYLSWAWAVDQLLRRDPAASWSYGQPEKYGDTMMVYCTVTAFGQPRTMQLPVMDHRNKAIANPDAFQVNTAMQRCLVKAIALHGLGLYIYAGEDLPDGAEKPEPDAVTRIKAAGMSGADVNKEAFDALGDEAQRYIADYATAVTDLHNSKGDVLGYLEANKLDAEEKMALWSLLPSNIRSAIKKAREETKPPQAKAA
jgi:hypothetical protein